MSVSFVGPPVVSVEDECDDDDDPTTLEVIEDPAFRFGNSRKCHNTPSLARWLSTKGSNGQYQNSDPLTRLPVSVDDRSAIFLQAGMVDPHLELVNAARSLSEMAFTGDAEGAQRVLAGGLVGAEGKTSALCSAATKGHASIVNLLVRSGADVHWNGDFPLCAAAQMGHVDTIDALIAGGADVHANGEMAATMAASHGQNASLEHLIAAGANVARSSLLCYAAARGHADTVAFLIQKGARWGTSKYDVRSKQLFDKSI